MSRPPYVLPGIYGLHPKLASQDNSQDQLSATGESDGLAYQHKDDDYAKGQDAWSSLGKYFKTNHQGGGQPVPFEGKHATDLDSIAKYAVSLMPEAIRQGIIPDPAAQGGAPQEEAIAPEGDPAAGGAPPPPEGDPAAAGAPPPQPGMQVMAADKVAAQGWPTVETDVEPNSLPQLQSKANGVISDAPGTNVENQRQTDSTDPVTSPLLTGLDSDISKRAAMFAKEAGLLSLGSKLVGAGKATGKAIGGAAKSVAKAEPVTWAKGQANKMVGRNQALTKRQGVNEIQKHLGRAPRAGQSPQAAANAQAITRKGGKYYSQGQEISHVAPSNTARAGLGWSRPPSGHQLLPKGSSPMAQANSGFVPVADVFGTARNMGGLYSAKRTVDAVGKARRAHTPLRAGQMPATHAPAAISPQASGAVALGQEGAAAQQAGRVGDLSLGKAIKRGPVAPPAAPAAPAAAPAAPAAAPAAPAPRPAGAPATGRPVGPANPDPSVGGLGRGPMADRAVRGSDEALRASTSYKNAVRFGASPKDAMELVRGQFQLGYQATKAPASGVSPHVAEALRKAEAAKAAKGVLSSPAELGRAAGALPAKGPVAAPAGNIAGPRGAAAQARGAEMANAGRTPKQTFTDSGAFPPIRGYGSGNAKLQVEQIQARLAARAAKGLPPPPPPAATGAAAAAKPAPAATAAPSKVNVDLNPTIPPGVMPNPVSTAGKTVTTGAPASTASNIPTQTFAQQTAGEVSSGRKWAGGAIGAGVLGGAGLIANATANMTPEQKGAYVTDQLTQALADPETQALFEKEYGSMHNYMQELKGNPEKQQQAADFLDSLMTEKGSGDRHMEKVALGRVGKWLGTKLLGKANLGASWVDDIALGGRGGAIQYAPAAAATAAHQANALGDMPADTSWTDRIMKGGVTAGAFTPHGRKFLFGAPPTKGLFTGTSVPTRMFLGGLGKATAFGIPEAVRRADRFSEGWANMGDIASGLKEGRPHLTLNGKKVFVSKENAPWLLEKYEHLTEQVNEGKVDERAVLSKLVEDGATYGQEKPLGEALHGNVAAGGEALEAVAESATAGAGSFAEGMEGVSEGATAGSKSFAKGMEGVSEGTQELGSAAKTLQYLPYLLGGGLGLGGLYLGYKVYRDWKEDKEKEDKGKKRGERLAGGKTSKRRAQSVRLGKPGAYTIDYEAKEAMEVDAHCGVCPEDLAEGVAKKTRGRISQSDLEAVMVSKVDDEVMKAGGVGGGIGGGVVGGDQLIAGTSDVGVSAGQQDGNVRTEDPNEHDMTENDIWGMSGAGGGARIASDMSPMAEGFLDNCKEAGMTQAQIKTAIDGLAETLDENTVSQLRHGLEKQARGAILGALGKLWSGTSKASPFVPKAMGSVAGYANPEISQALGAEKFEGGTPGWFSKRRLGGALAGGLLHRNLGKLNTAGKARIPGTPEIAARTRIPARPGWGGSPEIPARAAVPAVPGTPAVPGWQVGKNILEGSGGGVQGTLMGAGVDAGAGLLGHDTNHRFAQLGAFGGMAARSPWARAAAQAGTKARALAHGAPARLSPSGVVRPAVPGQGPGATLMQNIAGAGRDAFTMGRRAKGPAAGPLSGAATTAMWGGTAVGAGATGAIAIRDKAVQHTIKEGLKNPKVVAGLKQLDGLAEKATTWTKFTDGFNSFVDPIFKFMGMDPAKMSTTQKMLIAFGVLTAVGGGAAGLLGDSKAGGVIGILGALLAAGGALGVGGKSGPLSSLFGGQTGAEGAGDIAGAPKTTAPSAPAAPTPPPAALHPELKKIWGQITPASRRQFAQMTPPEQAKAVAHLTSNAAPGQPAPMGAEQRLHDPRYTGAKTVPSTVTVKTDPNSPPVKIDRGARNNKLMEERMRKGGR